MYQLPSMVMQHTALSGSSGATTWQLGVGLCLQAAHLDSSKNEDGEQGHNCHSNARTNSSLGP